VKKRFPYQFVRLFVQKMIKCNILKNHQKGQSFHE